MSSNTVALDRARHSLRNGRAGHRALQAELADSATVLTLLQDPNALVRARAARVGVHALTDAEACTQLLAADTFRDCTVLAKALAARGRAGPASSAVTQLSAARTECDRAALLLPFADSATVEGCLVVGWPTSPATLNATALARVWQDLARKHPHVIVRALPGTWACGVPPLSCLERAGTGAPSAMLAALVSLQGSPLAPLATRAGEAQPLVTLEAARVVRPLLAMLQAKVPATELAAALLHCVGVPGGRGRQRQTGGRLQAGAGGGDPNAALDWSWTSSSLRKLRKELPLCEALIDAGWLAVMPDCRKLPVRTVAALLHTDAPSCTRAVSLTTVQRLALPVRGHLNASTLATLPAAAREHVVRVTLDDPTLAAHMRGGYAAVTADRATAEQAVGEALASADGSTRCMGVANVAIGALRYANDRVAAALDSLAVRAKEAAPARSQLVATLRSALQERPRPKMTLAQLEGMEKVVSALLAPPDSHPALQSECACLLISLASARSPATHSHRVGVEWVGPALARFVARHRLPSATWQLHLSSTPFISAPDSDPAVLSAVEHALWSAYGGSILPPMTTVLAAAQEVQEALSARSEARGVDTDAPVWPPSLPVASAGAVEEFCAKFVSRHGGRRVKQTGAASNLFSSVRRATAFLVASSQVGVVEGPSPAALAPRGLDSAKAFTSLVSTDLDRALLLVCALLTPDSQERVHRVLSLPFWRKACVELAHLHRPALLTPALQEVLLQTQEVGQAGPRLPYAGLPDSVKSYRCWSEASQCVYGTALVARAYASAGVEMVWRSESTSDNGARWTPGALPRVAAQQPQRTPTSDIHRCLRAAACLPLLSAECRRAIVALAGDGVHRAARMDEAQRQKAALVQDGRRDMEQGGEEGGEEDERRETEPSAGIQTLDYAAQDVTDTAVAKAALGACARLNEGEGFPMLWAALPLNTTAKAAAETALAHLDEVPAAVVAGHVSIALTAGVGVSAQKAVIRLLRRLPLHLSVPVLVEIGSRDTLHKDARAALITPLWTIAQDCAETAQGDAVWEFFGRSAEGAAACKPEEVQADRRKLAVVVASAQQLAQLRFTCLVDGEECRSSPATRAYARRVLLPLLQSPLAAIRAMAIGRVSGGEPMWRPDDDRPVRAVTSELEAMVSGRGTGVEGTGARALTTKHERNVLASERSSAASALLSNAMARSADAQDVAVVIRLVQASCEWAPTEYSTPGWCEKVERLTALVEGAHRPRGATLEHAKAHMAVCTALCAVLDPLAACTVSGGEAGTPTRVHPFSVGLLVTGLRLAASSTTAEAVAVLATVPPAQWERGVGQSVRDAIGRGDVKRWGGLEELEAALLAAAGKEGALAASSLVQSALAVFVSHVERPVSGGSGGWTQERLARLRGVYAQHPDGAVAHLGAAALVQAVRRVEAAVVDKA